MFGIWQVGDETGPSRLERSSIPSESHLEKWVSANPEMIRPGLHKVRNQVDLLGKRLDLLCIEEPSTWVVVEFKNARLERRVLAQAVDYGARLAEMTHAQLSDEVRREFPTLSEEVKQLVERALEDEASGESRSIRLLVAGTDINEDLQRMIRFQTSYDVPISSCVLRSFASPSGGHLLIREDYEEAFTEPVTGEVSNSTKVRIQTVLQNAESNANRELMEFIFDQFSSNPYVSLVPYKRGVMISPRSNRSRYLAYFGTRQKGIKLELGLDPILEFFPSANTEALIDIQTAARTVDRDYILNWAQTLNSVLEAAGELDAGDPEDSSWNGKDWYVAFGEADGGRNWEDAMELGFVCAGGGKWYSQTLQNIPIGSRVFVYIPQVGYVGVGTTRSEAVPFSDSAFAKNGRLRGNYEHPNGELEYVVEIDWLAAVDRENAFKQKGLFANQNSACKLSHKRTITSVLGQFGLG